MILLSYDAHETLLLLSLLNKGNIRHEIIRNDDMICHDFMWLIIIINHNLLICYGIKRLTVHVTYSLTDDLSRKLFAVYQVIEVDSRTVYVVYWDESL